MCYYITYNQSTTYSFHTHLIIKKLAVLLTLLLITSFFYTSSNTWVSFVQPQTMLSLARVGLDNTGGNYTAPPISTVPVINCSCVAPENLDEPKCKNRGGEVKFSTAKSMFTSKASAGKIVCGDERGKIGGTEVKFVEDLNCEKQKTEGEPKVQKCSVEISSEDMEKLSWIQVASSDPEKLNLPNSPEGNGGGVGTSFPDSANAVDDTPVSIADTVEPAPPTPQPIPDSQTSPTSQLPSTQVTPIPTPTSPTLNPISAPDRPEGSVIPENRSVAWNNQRNSNQQPWLQQQNQNNNQQLNSEPQNSNPLRRMFSSFTNPSYAPRPELAREAREQRTPSRESNTNGKVAFNDIYKMETGDISISMNERYNKLDLKLNELKF